VKQKYLWNDTFGTTLFSVGWRIQKRGATLSVGQRQRISIARAFLRDAPLLVLDEFTSALDAGTERTVRASLRDLRKGKTTIIISHHPQVLADADRVILLEKGRITAEGRYGELEGRGGGLYRGSGPAYRGSAVDWGGDPVRPQCITRWFRFTGLVGI